MGRRCIKKITVNGVITLHHRYIYRGYLQIACADLTRSGRPCLWLTMWDSSDPVATKPLAIQKNATWYTYGHDLTKNVTELYKTNGTIATAYDYTPFGQVTASGTAEQPIQWSSEFNDTELGLVYYNYRHYNPQDGRWINRDPIAEQGGWNLYRFVKNNCSTLIDSLGKKLEKLNLSSNQIPLEFVNDLPEYIAGRTEFNTEVGIKQENDENDVEKKKPVISVRKQSLAIRINTNLGTDPNAGKHSFIINNHKQTTEWHERHHASLYIKGWNEGIEKVNRQEKSLCDKCYVYQENIIQYEFQLMANTYQLENKKFDKEFSAENTDSYILSLLMESISLSTNISVLEQLKESLSCE